MRRPLPRSHLVLVVDDNPAIHEDFRKVFSLDGDAEAELADAEALLFGAPSAPVPPESFELVTAPQGQAGVERFREQLATGRRFDLAFVDMRMPPGFDGLETARRLWRLDPGLYVVLCTAHTDCGWRELQDLGPHRHQLVFLRKPFDALEIRQLASVLLALRPAGEAL